MTDVADIKRAAAGRWPEILSRLGGVDQNDLDGKHHPCPKCGGRDRFRLLDESAGALYCNKCFTNENGDGISALMWLLGCEFSEVAKRLTDYLALGNGHRTAPALDIVSEMARRKRMPPESFKAFGAHEAKRGKLTVARVPMFDEHGQKCSYFDMATISPEFEKGLSEKDGQVGLFLFSTPKLGETVLLTEGVKDAAALHGLGYFSVGLPTKEMNIKFARLFIGCDVVIVPDRDSAGEEGANLTASRLSGTAASVKVATLPSELKQTGGDGVREILAKRNGEVLLRQAIADAQTWTPETRGPSKKVVTMIQACHVYLDALEAGTNATLSTGLPDLDAAIGGVAASEMVVVGARPSHGKTMFALQWLDTAAASGVPGLFISEEMSAMGLGKRALHLLSEIESKEWREYAGAMREDVNAHYEPRKEIYIAESCCTADMACQVIEEQVSKHKVGIVAVDYAQLLKGTGGNRYEQVTNVSIAMKQCSVKFGVVLLLLCQLSRDIEKRNERTPKMSDLRDSGQFEQDADVILFLQWPLQDDPKYKPHNEYRIHVAKNRNRQIDSRLVVTTFNAGRQRLEKREYEPTNFGSDWNNQ